MMSAISLSELAQRCGVPAPAHNLEFTSVSTDSRKLQRGDLFVALRGDRFDGHAFLRQAAEQGACAAIVEESLQDVHIPQLVVRDTVKALGYLGAINREKFTGPVLGITGSSGKTTVKEMTASILRQRGDVLVTRGNLNNHIGVPLMLLELEPHHRFAVIEMGASAVGEIGWLASLAQPQVAVINNVGTAHVEGFGSVDNIAKGKGEIYDSLGSDGTAVINRDDAYCQQWQQQNKGRSTLTYSVRQQADVIAKNIRGDSVGLFAFTLCHRDDSVDVHLALLGEHNVANALAAATCCIALGMDLSTICAGLAAVTPVAGRMQYKQGVNDLAIIDDTYNANSASVRAAIDALSNMKGVQVLVLGDMAELGDLSVSLHTEIGAYARQKGIKQLLATGIHTRYSVEAFGVGATHYDNKQALAEACLKIASASTVMLVKGSRSSGMEAVVNYLLKEETTSC